MSRVTVETPKGSFVKYRLEKGLFHPELASPFPTLFNYGFVEGATGKDGMPKDCIILGKKLKQGEEMELNPLGEVHFIDDGKEDDKIIFSHEGKIKTLDKIGIHLFFTAYATFKAIRYLAKERRLTECRYKGYKLL